MIEQVIISVIIVTALFLFVWGKWRYDIVALLALFAAALFGLISFDEIFLGFVHPVVILIVAMLIISKGLINSGVVDIVARYFKFSDRHPIVELGVLTAFTVFLSAFINSLGALAFVVPIAARIAKQTKTPLSLFLMPLAFGSHFGGSITLIGSVSNIVVSGFRNQAGEPFAFFDFAFVALPVALISILFIVLAGWRLLPKRQDVFSRQDLSKNYLTELKILDKSVAAGKTIKDFQKFSKERFKVLALDRKGLYIQKPSLDTVLQKEDVLVIETEAESLESIITTAELEILYKKPFDAKEKDTKNLEIVEVVVSPKSQLIGENAKTFDLHDVYQINLLALHRPEQKIQQRLGNIRFRAGDVLIIQGEKDQVSQFILFFNLLSLKEREFHFEGKKERAFLSGAIFLGAVLVSMAGVFPVHLIFAISALLIILTGALPVKNMYDSVDFSLIILIAVMLQLGNVFYQTGAASSLAGLLFLFENISPQIALAFVLLFSVWLTDVLSNVTVAVLLSPVAFSVAQTLAVSADPFLIAVALGAGSSYLTPIGHQSNIFIMGIGGYRFSDYWKLGLPLEIITFVVGFFLIPYFWPF